MQVTNEGRTTKTDASCYQLAAASVRHLLALLCAAMVLATPAAPAAAETLWPKVAVSRDGTPISYESYGSGSPVLVLVHGWSCDARYWHEQIGFFAGRQQVVVLDLGGHGHSGSGRTIYSMQSFGEDVRAVMDAERIDEAILVGHSMGGSVIVEAARLLPNRVIGLIGVDTLENVAYPLGEEELAGMVAPLEQDFVSGAKQFVAQMLYPTTDEQLREWIMSDMAAAPPRVALSAMREMMGQYVTGEAARLFAEVRLPVVTVNGDLWPIDYEANRKHMLSFDAFVIEGGDHFLMMNRPEAFNQALEKAIVLLMNR